MKSLGKLVYNREYEKEITDISDEMASSSHHGEGSRDEIAGPMPLTQAIKGRKRLLGLFHTLVAQAGMREKGVLVLHQI
jgi:hypothetical protein